MTRIARPLIVPVLVVLLAAGCTRDDPAGAFDDATLFAAIEGLNGVASSTVTYQDTLGTSRLYSGTVQVVDGADPRCVLYQTLALLEQGRPLASSSIRVEQGDRTLDQSNVPAGAWSALESITPTPSTDPMVPDCGAVDLGAPGDAAPGAAGASPSAGS
jgi:hypothetical protein